MTAAPPHLLDNTLREGAQVPGVAFDADDARAIAAALDAAGVDMLDLGLPADEADWRRLANLAGALEHAAGGVTIRALAEDVAACAHYGLRDAFVMLPASELHLEHKFGWTADLALERLRDLGAAGKQFGVTLHVVAEDASRASADLTARFAAAADAAGAATLYLCDTVGVWTPSAAAAAVRTAVAAAPTLAVGVHCHNDFGMATANTVAATEAGAAWLSCTTNGLGERAGNARSLEVAAALAKLLELPVGWDLRGLADAARLVEQLAGIPLPVQAPLVGWCAFRHASGIHVDGLLKDTRVYEPIDPADVGAARNFVLAASSGRAHVRHLLATMSLELDEAQVDALTAAVRGRAATRRLPATIREQLHAALDGLGVDRDTFAALVANVRGEAGA